MSVRGANVPSHPGNAAIFSVQNAYAGTIISPMGNPNTNFGYGNGPNVPMRPWMPSRGGPTMDVDSMMRFLNNGQAPNRHGHVTLKTWDFIQYQYMVPPWGDESHLQIMPHMLVWTLNYLDTSTDSTHMATLPQLNALMDEAYNVFQTMIDNQSDFFNEEAMRFQGYLEEFGEAGLELYAEAVRDGKLKDWADGPMRWDGTRDPENRMEGFDENQSQLKDMYELAQKDIFRYVTKWGILRHWSFAGSVINASTATSTRALDTTDEEDHYTDVNVAIGKRAEVANVFGPKSQIDTGSVVWAMLTRRQRHDGTYGAFTIIPGGSKTKIPYQRDRFYADESGMMRMAHIWKIGTVTEPGEADPRPESQLSASNTGVNISNSLACNHHALLPTIWLAMGFKH